MKQTSFAGFHQVLCVRINPWPPDQSCFILVIPECHHRRTVELFLCQYLISPQSTRVVNIQFLAVSWYVLRLCQLFVSILIALVSKLWILLSCNQSSCKFVWNHLHVVLWRVSINKIISPCDLGSSSVSGRVR